MTNFLKLKYQEKDLKSQPKRFQSKATAMVQNKHNVDILKIEFRHIQSKKKNLDI